MGQNPNLDDARAVAALIDHTLLKPDAVRSDIRRLCEEAREYSFASVCVNPCWVDLAAEVLAGSESLVCTVIGFPLGANKASVKLAEAATAIDDGASELDMVQNVGALRVGETDWVRSEIRELAQLVHAHSAKLKVIIETSLLSEDQKVTSCMLALEAGADFVKTSTGFSGGGATIADVKLMRRTVDSKMGVKASGGIRSLDTLRQMVRAGASRIGTSSGVAIIRELSSRTEGAPEKQTGAAY